MKQFILSTAAWLSLLLLAAVVATWIWSYPATTTARVLSFWPRPLHPNMVRAQVTLERGRLMISRETATCDLDHIFAVEELMAGTEGRGVLWTRDPYADELQTPNWLGFAYYSGPSMWRMIEAPPSVIRWVILPLWLPAILLAIWPARWAWRLRDIHRAKRRGLCLKCGYDLRASRDRCPECGSPTSQIPPRNWMARLGPAALGTCLAATICISPFLEVSRVQRRETAYWARYDSDQAILGAVDGDDVDAARSVLDAGADANAFDVEKQHSAISIASTCNHQHRLEMVKLLLNHGAAVNGSEMDAADSSPIFSAVSAWDVKLCDLLLKRGADPNTQKSPEPLLSVVARDCPDAEEMIPLLRVLLRAGADPNARDAAGNTALHYLAASPWANTVAHDLLLAAHADPNLRNAAGDSVLLAILKADGCGTELLRKLLAAHTDPNARDSAGNTALLLMARYPMYPESLQLLLSAGANPNVHDLHGVTPLHEAAANWDTDTVRELLKAGGNPLAKDDSGRLPRDMAGANEEICHLLDSSNAGTVPRH